MLLLKLAFRNIGRNPRRSLITLLAVSVGLAAIIFLWGFSDGTTEQQRENVIRFFTGHLQIYAKGFEQTLAPELVIPERSQIIEKLQKEKEIVAITERVKCEALVGTSENSRGVLLIGIDPERELRVTELNKHIRKGEFLSPGNQKEILLGERLAHKLKVDVGDKAVVLTQAVDGTMAGYSYRVKGITSTGSRQIDELTAYIPLESSRELLGLENASHEIVVRLSSRGAIPDFLERIKKYLDDARYEIFTWDQIVPEVEQWVIWAEAVISTILVAVMIVVGVSIMNTVLMSVLERTKELGVMLAVGTKPSQIIYLILLETLILELIGIFFGVLAGYAIVFYFSRAGIHFHGVEEAFATTFMSTTVYTQVRFSHVLESILTLLFLTGFIGLYPAWKAGRMQPVKAIYHSY